MTALGPDVPLAGRVGLVTGSGSDQDAIAEVRTVLTGAGVRTIDQVADPGSLAPGETAIFVGGADENPPAGPVLTALGVADATSLAAEGYVLADGVVSGRGGPAIVSTARSRCRTCACSRSSSR